MHDGMHTNMVYPLKHGFVPVKHRFCNSQMTSFRTWKGGRRQTSCCWISPKRIPQ